MRSDERRRHVRIRPIPELLARVRRTEGQGTDLELFDVSIGGLGFVTERGFVDALRDQRVPIRLELGRYGVYDIVAVVKHVGSATTGTEIDAPTPALTTALGRYIAELLERGAPS